jgi:trehalose 6-phosphate phosphatase
MSLSYAGRRRRDSLRDSVTTSLLDAFLQQLKTAPSSALLLDYDGTLAPFHVDRNRAFPYPRAISILEKIAAQSGRTKVIIISGRPIVELRALLAPMNNLEMWGTHGLERQLSNGSYSCVPINEEDAEALAKAQEWIVAAGLLSTAEIKLGGIAIHWRGLSRAEAKNVQSLTLDGWTKIAEQSRLKLLQFEAGLELRVSHPDKGDAVTAILADLEPRAPVAYLGDDLTDEDAFRVLNGQGLTVLVKDTYRETNADTWIRPPRELIDLLERWLINISG